MYAKIVSTKWDGRGPALSYVADSSYEHVFEFAHEPECLMQHAGGDSCTCYVSRIRLVPTPAGDFLPTTERDLSADLVFWHNEAERLRRSNLVLCIWLGAVSVALLAAGLWLS